MLLVPVCSLPGVLATLFFWGADVRSAGILFSCFALGAVMVAYFLAAILPADPVISFLPETFNLGSA